MELVEFIVYFVYTPVYLVDLSKQTAKPTFVSVLVVSYSWVSSSLSSYYKRKIKGSHILSRDIFRLNSKVEISVPTRFRIRNLSLFGPHCGSRK